MLFFAGPLVGRGGLGWLLRFLIRVVIWHLIFHTVGGFLGRYTHLPPVVNVIILIVVIVGIRYTAVYLRRRRA